MTVKENPPGTDSQRQPRNAPPGKMAKTLAQSNTDAPKETAPVATSASTGQSGGQAAPLQ